MQAIKRQQTESMIKQQELMSKMVISARENGASPQLMQELEMLSNPAGWGITTDGIDDQVQVGPLRVLVLARARGWVRLCVCLHGFMVPSGHDSQVDRQRAAKRGSVFAGVFSSASGLLGRGGGSSW